MRYLKTFLLCLAIFVGLLLFTSLLFTIWPITFELFENATGMYMTIGEYWSTLWLKLIFAIGASAIFAFIYNIVEDD